MATFTKKSFAAKGLFPANPDLAPRKTSAPRGTVRAPKPLCPRCWVRPSKYALCDERGHKISQAGLCEKCQCPQMPDEDDLMRAAIEAERADVPSADEATVAALYAEADEAFERANRAWIDACYARNEWKELHDEFNHALKVGDMNDDVREISTRIDELEAAYPLLCSRISARPPYPNAAPFI